MTVYDLRISDWSSDVCSSDLPDVLVPQPDDAVQAVAGLVEEAGDRQAARGAAVGQHRRRRPEPQPRDVVVEALGVVAVVGVAGGDAGEEILERLAGHQAAVGQLGRGPGGYRVWQYV